MQQALENAQGAACDRQNTEEQHLLSFAAGPWKHRKTAGWQSKGSNFGRARNSTQAQRSPVLPGHLCLPQALLTDTGACTVPAPLQREGSSSEGAKEQPADGAIELPALPACCMSSTGKATAGTLIPKTMDWADIYSTLPGTAGGKKNLQNYTSCLLSIPSKLQAGCNSKSMS